MKSLTSKNKNLALNKALKLGQIKINLEINGKSIKNQNNFNQAISKIINNHL